MAITKFKEIRRSRSRNKSADAQTARREYMLWYGTGDDAEAYIEAHAPASILAPDGALLLPTALDLSPHENDGTIWTAVVDYSTAPKKERSGVGDETVSFDLSSQSVKTTQSLSTVNSYVASGTAPDFKGGIGYKDGKFDGADRFVEAFSFSVTKILANSSITNAYIQSLRNTAFRWNDAPYRGQATGEALFVGAAGSPRDRETYTITYKFLASKNASGLTLGGISGIAKNGWDYLWALYEDVADTTAKFVTPRPLAVYIERLYTSASFTANLGLSAGT